MMEASPGNCKNCSFKVEKDPFAPGVSVHSRHTIKVSINRSSVSHNGGIDHAEQLSK